MSYYGGQVLIRLFGLFGRCERVLQFRQCFVGAGNVGLGFLQSEFVTEPTGEGELVHVLGGASVEEVWGGGGGGGKDPSASAILE